MKNTHFLLIFALFSLPGALYAQTPATGLQGVVTDPSGATVQDALVQLRGPGGEQRATTDLAGRYNFPTLRPGKYVVRVIARGFTVSQRRDYQIRDTQTLDVQLTIEAQSQVINVEAEAGKVSVDPDSNASAGVSEKELAALSDDPPRSSCRPWPARRRGPTAGRFTSTIFRRRYAAESPSAKCASTEPY